ncbi:hypothetical protein RB601_003136 [Gaeumannomyces tritici]
MDDAKFYAIALEEAREGFDEGGIPVRLDSRAHSATYPWTTRLSNALHQIGAALVSSNGRLLGRGRNLRVQQGSAIHHGETAALANSGRLPASAYKGNTMYTTLSPCDMCTGACLLYGIGRVVIGENKTFLGGEAYLKQRGVEVVVLDDAESRGLMESFIEKHPELWNEDIGVEKRVYTKE